jgi:hypothetical protein
MVLALAAGGTIRLLVQGASWLDAIVDSAGIFYKGFCVFPSSLCQARNAVARALSLCKWACPPSARRRAGHAQPRVGGGAGAPCPPAGWPEQPQNCAMPDCSLRYVAITNQPYIYQATPAPPPARPPPARARQLPCSMRDRYWYSLHCISPLQTQPKHKLETQPPSFGPWCSSTACSAPNYAQSLHPWTAMLAQAWAVRGPLWAGTFCPSLHA